jgi:hypothetical protein
MTSKRQAAFKRWPALHFDPEKYRQFVERYDLSEIQKQQLMDDVWRITVSFVDYGFGIHPLQYVIDGEKDSGSGFPPW